MMELQKDDLKISLNYFHGPITALQHFNGYIMAGKGPYVHVYTLSSSDAPLFSLQVFAAARVHGMAIDNDWICVYGAKSVHVLSWDQTRLVSVSGEREVTDWIWDVAWMATSPATLALVLAHNNVLHYDWRAAVILAEVRCVEACILYTARLLGNTWDSLTVLAGTVFNQVVIWSTIHLVNEGRAKVLARLACHTGVIFGLDYQPQLQLLCSVSDDRSLAAWQVSWPGVGASPDWSRSRLTPIFRVFAHVARVWDVRITPHLIITIGEDSCCCVWSHDGKVIKTYRGHQGASIRSISVCDAGIVTGGGDGGIHLWPLPHYTSQGSHDSPNKTVAMPHNCGADSSDPECPSPSVLGPDSGCNDFCGSEESTSITTKQRQRKLVPPDSEPPFFPRSVRFLSNQLLVMADCGTLYSYDVILKSWTIIFSDDRYRSYSVLEVACPPRNQCDSSDMCRAASGLFAVGSMYGHIRVMQKSGDAWISCEEKVYSGKVLSLSWQESGTEQGCSEQSVHSLLCCGPNGSVIMWQVSTLAEQSTPVARLEMTQIQRFTLPYSKQRWLVSAVSLPVAVPGSGPQTCGARLTSATRRRHGLTPAAGRHHGDLVMAGDRAGSVHMFDVADGGAPSESLWKLHGRGGVTHIFCHDDGVYSCGRDGRVRRYSLADSRPALLHAHRVHKGFEWLSRLLLWEGELAVAGFHNNCFVVKRVKTGEPLMSLECGGGHRAWDLHLGRPSGQDVRQGVSEAVMFAHIKSRDVVLCEASLAHNGITLTPGLHSGAILSVTHVARWRDARHVVWRVCATAGEDCRVKLVAVAECGGRLTQLGTVAQHVSSARCLAASPSPLARTLLFSGGGRAQLVATTLLARGSQCATPAAPLRGLHIEGHVRDDSTRHGAPADDATDEASSRVDILEGYFEKCFIHQQGGVYTLHGKRARRRPQADIDAEPETRVMDVSAMCVSVWTQDVAHSDAHVVLCAGSDGTLTLLCYEEGAKRFQPLASHVPHSHCLLRAQLVMVPPSGTESRLLAIVTSTDGTVKFWDITYILKRYLDTKRDISDSDDERNTKYSGHECSVEKMGTLLRVSLLEAAEAFGDTEEYYSLSDTLVAGEEPMLDLDSNPECLDVTVGTNRLFGDDEGKLPALGLPTLTLAAHQSGVNALHCVHGDDGLVTLATGGDDNALCVYRLRTGDNKYDVVSSVREDSAHAAQITGVFICDEHSVLTVSIDQRLTLWGVQFEYAEGSGTSSHRLWRRLTKFTHVSDISNMAVWRVGGAWQVMLSGVGLQVLAMEL